MPKGDDTASRKPTPKKAVPPERPHDKPREKPGDKSSEKPQDKKGAGASASSTPKGAERRRHRRVPAAFPLKIVNEAGEEEAFRLLDLSECGARIQCGHSVPPMTRIQVALLLPGRGLGLAKDVRVDTTGVIVWCHRVTDAEYDTGVFFPDLQEEQRGMLRALVLAAR